MPDSTPVYGISRQSGPWEWMYHGTAFAAYDRMNGPRGDRDLTGPNWAMAMGRRRIGSDSELQLRGMVSLDPVTVGGGGYPLLLQTGESWRGQPLMDHQHPHNYVSELAAQYRRATGPSSVASLYLGVVGEPALGPPAFMHRTLALDDPLAPIGHHWQDSTHIAYGVVTLGYATRTWQIELSTFNGREPGENRSRIESPEFDSASARLSHNPSPEWALQVSHGYLRRPEALHPEADIHRTTASAIFNRRLDERRNWQSAFVWGRNRVAGHDYDSFLLEASRKRDGGWSPYVRLEQVSKSSEELVLPSGFTASKGHLVRQFTLGAVRDLPIGGGYQWGVGGQVILSTVPDALEPVYGHNPTGWLVFVRVHPRQMEHRQQAPTARPEEREADGHGAHGSHP
ncbi:MAG: hypothetical protein HPY69_00720 [Armatimonadetes bacterium]|nr:hypothetical protein [Armatimonadota bacterium]